MRDLPPFVTAGLAFLGILLVLRLSFPYFGPFYIGLLLAFVLDMPVSFFEAKGWSRSLTSLVLSLALFLTLPMIIGLFVVQLWGEIQRLADVSSFLSSQAQLFLEPLLDVLPNLDAGLDLQTLAKWVWAIPDFFLMWTISAFSAYFFCRDKRALTKFILKQLPSHGGFSPRQIYRDTSGALWHYIQVQLLFMLISTGLSMVLFLLLDLPYPLLAAFLVGFFDLCPILGPGLVYLILAIIQSWLGNPLTALALGISYLVLLLLRQWGEPHLVSERLGLHPLAALAGLYAGFRFWGPFGALLGPVVMVFLKAFIRKD
ncbi:MAG TPA: AI-2E family transporter [Limnochordia bacterium]|nr:AI-2E family transporter [Limnochordia bacterium]